MTHQESASSKTRMSRSPSKHRSRSSEKFLDSDKLSVPKFRLTTKSPSPSPRRASATHLSTAGSSSRSRSLRAKRHSTFIPHSHSGTHLSALASSPRSGGVSPSLSVPDGDEGEFHLVRNFSLTSKGVVNRGDSFRCKSSRSGSVCSTPTSVGSENNFPALSSNSGSGDHLLVQSGASGGGGASAEGTPTAVALSPPGGDLPKYTVWLIGANAVGKTAIRNQFMTSEYISQFDSWQDDTPVKTVMVSLDGVESELEIVECATVDDKIRSKDSLPDAFIIVYSVTNRRSYVQAKQIVSRLETFFGSRAVILVGNKTDLARLRTVTTVEGRSLATERGIKFIETSVAFNHQLDELLVGVVTQIRIKAKAAEKKRAPGTRSKASCIIKRLWRKTCVTSKSCDNLHAL